MVPALCPLDAYMAFFKFRKSGGDPVAAAASPAESVEALRRRALHRLIGAAVLVLAGVIGFPLVFDSQPRPIAVDIPIEIPDRAGKTSKPASAVLPATQAAAGPVVGGDAVVVRPEPPAAASAPPAVFQPAASAAPAPPPPPVPPAAAAPVPAPTVSTAASAPPKAASAPTDDSRARAMLDGQSASAPSAGRFVVQVGAFADAAKAQAARRKLEAAGLKTYTHIADTKEGKRTRVRVGPFDSRAEADKAAAKVKGLDLPAAVLVL